MPRAPGRAKPSRPAARVPVAVVPPLDLLLGPADMGRYAAVGDAHRTRGIGRVSHVAYILRAAPVLRGSCRGLRLSRGKSALDRAGAAFTAVPVLLEAHDAYLLALEAPVVSRLRQEEVCRRVDKVGGIAAAFAVDLLEVPIAPVREFGERVVTHEQRRQARMHELGNRVRSELAALLAAGVPLDVSAHS